MQLLFASTLVHMYSLVIYSTTEVICDSLILTHNEGEMCENACNHGVFNDVLPSPTFNVFI
jgi:hypothetical protein